MGQRGWETPEQAVAPPDDIPARYVTILGSHVDGDRATVWFLTNDRPPFEPYESYCVRDEHGLWYDVGGSGGFSVDTPKHILRAARLEGYS